MRANPPNDRSRPLLVLGSVHNVSDLALRRILHAKKRGQALVIVDYQGNLAPFLTEKNKGNLHKGPLMWCDLGNRRRPIALFRCKRTVGMKIALHGFLKNCIDLVAADVSNRTVTAVVELVYRLADGGSIGLAALARCLRRSDTSFSLRRDPTLAHEIDLLAGLLDWMLRFPSVWALSEGNNAVDTYTVMRMGGTLWIEMHASHFEKFEHQIAAWMVDAMVLDALLSSSSLTSDAAKPAPIVVYGYPPTCPIAMTIDTVDAKQVGLFSLTTTRTLPDAAKIWLTQNADCWVTGEVGDMAGYTKSGLLSAAESIRLKELQSGQVWVRSGATKKAVTTLVRIPEALQSLSQGFRHLAAKLRYLTPVKQFVSAISNEHVLAPQNADIYKKLCTKEALYAGWYRVKGSNSQSHGSDHITIEKFGFSLDVELEKLNQELMDGRYQCRALRTARVPKADGDFRVLKIACVRDRVVQAACLHLIEPLFDARFSPTSFAYRQGRSAHHAVAFVRSVIRTGKRWIVTADIRKCFDRINHDILLRLVGDVICDPSLIQLIRHWLTAEVIDFMDVIPLELGVPQGEAISPLLANIYLDLLDKELERSGITFARYADDYVVLCDSEAGAQAALRLMGDFLQEALQLELKPAKTQYCHVDEGFEFLGFRIEAADIQIQYAKIVNALQHLQKFVANIALTSSITMESYQTILRMNALTRGFRNYFLVDNASAVLVQFAQMDAQIETTAKQQFTLAMTAEPAWVTREKFVPFENQATKYAQISAEVNLMTGGYPQEATVIEQAVSISHQKSLPTAIAIPTNDPLDTDILLIDGRLHVMTSGCYVTIQSDEVVIRRRKKELFRQTISDLVMVYLEGRGIAISADLTMQLCNKGIPVVFTPLIGMPSAVAQPIQSTRASLRQQQVLRRNDLDILKIGLSMLSAKVANQASVLKYFARYRKRTDSGLYNELTRYSEDMRGIAESLGGFDPSTHSVRTIAMGHEGRAAAKYWSAFAQLVPKELSFPGRHTQHAADPINSAVNYIYGMLYGEVWRSVIRMGLDPYFGIIHGSDRNQGSLVFDMIEEFRAPFGDRIVLGLIGRGFNLELDKEGRLKSTCRSKLAHSFHKHWHRSVRWQGDTATPFHILEHQVTSLKKAYLGEEEYRPFRFRW